MTNQEIYTAFEVAGLTKENTYNGRMTSDFAEKVISEIAEMGRLRESYIRGLLTDFFDPNRGRKELADVLVQRILNLPKGKYKPFIGYIVESVHQERRIGYNELVNIVTDVTLLYPNGKRKNETLLRSDVVAESPDSVFDHISLVALGYEPYMTLNQKILRHIEKVQKYIDTENILFDEEKSTLFKIGQKIIFNNV